MRKKHWRCFMGQNNVDLTSTEHLTIVTDHKPLTSFKTADMNTQVQKLRFKLSEYDYTVIYKPEKENTNADAFWRNPIHFFPVNAITRGRK